MKAENLSTIHDVERDPVPDADLHQTARPVPVVVEARLPLPDLRCVTVFAEPARRRLKPDLQQIARGFQQGLQVNFIRHESAVERQHRLAIQQNAAFVVEASATQPDPASLPDPFVGDLRLIEPVAILYPFGATGVQPHIPVFQETSLQQRLLHGAGNRRADRTNFRLRRMMNVFEVVDFPEIRRDPDELPRQLSEVVAFLRGRRRRH